MKKSLKILVQMKKPSTKFTYINREIYLSVLIAEVEELESRLQPGGTGHLHTTINVLNQRIEEIKKSL